MYKLGCETLNICKCRPYLNFTLEYIYRNQISKILWHDVDDRRTCCGGSRCCSKKTFYLNKICAFERYLAIWPKDFFPNGDKHVLRYQLVNLYILKNIKGKYKWKKLFYQPRILGNKNCKYFIYNILLVDLILESYLFFSLCVTTRKFWRIQGIS